MAFDPLDHPCRHCRVGPKEQCKNYRGQNKQACPDRGKAPEPAPRKRVQRGLFDQPSPQEEE